MLAIASSATRSDPCMGKRRRADDEGVADVIHANWKRVLRRLRGSTAVERFLLRVYYKIRKAKYEAEGNAVSKLEDAPT